MTAPSGPGVYFFFDDDRALLYVGKANNLQRRLQQHAKSDSARYGQVREIAWEELPTDDEATAREADLICAFRPPFNARGVQEPWRFVVVSDAELAVSDAAQGRAYGCFAGIGPGAISAPSIARSDGYASLLRLLWAAGDAPLGSQVPRKIAGPSPPLRFPFHLDPAIEPLLHAFLSGTSPRLLVGLGAHRDAYMQPALARDRAMAEQFFVYGPRRLRALRLRHGLRPGPVSAEQLRSLLEAELHTTIGQFRTLAP